MNHLFPLATTNALALIAAAGARADALLGLGHAWGVFDEPDSLADDPVSGEPVSPDTPCFPLFFCKIRGVFLVFRRRFRLMCCRIYLFFSRLEP
jgi:hypothetical protein